ncbi:carbamoyl-phosphate synthase (glutamine-hydrolyzing) large subunit [Virgibacillus dakarensis]|uniref:carbamoyl-phosphate synthase (glutamine-hydrolyzing) large subunit n=1 Tax=Lentibacillus populi TaxID=1827502 RepID=UPI000C8229B1|nr:carbamoyl-phosphate synthase (glutamine-hydrolyzing) large subunit [Lentibacillus populi]MBT2214384.1 carbamoyl-phosphate synthase (glutamine-hydrolyzing) large subunit [Virgibacillus dakarensis]
MNQVKKVLVIGSGPIVIGQAAEFDYAGTEACLALKEEGIEVVLLNNNPATIMTDETVADRIYLEPMTVNSIENIFEKERPDGLIGTLGGQTGLNLTLEVHNSGLLEKYDVQLLGTSVNSMQNGEDREKFRALMQELNEPVPDSHIITTVEQAVSRAEEIGYPVIIRPAYTLGGTGGGFAENSLQLQSIVTNGLQISPIHQVLLEKSIKGFKEIEFEVIRDVHDDCVIVCSMENVDPVGVHTGDSIVVAPAQTLTEQQNTMLCNAAVTIIRELGVIGACNIQFALAHDTNEYYVIEVNPRVSRSSALASKATGCPIAKIATKLALGQSLDDYFPSKTDTVHQLFIDYTVVKIPRFSFDKFPEADRELGTQMKATGETMAIDLTFEAALNKAVRSLDNGLTSLQHPLITGKDYPVLLEHMQQPTDLRLFAVAEALRMGKGVQEIYHLTAISRLFLKKIKQIVGMEQTLKTASLDKVTAEQLLQAKHLQISNKALAEFFQATEQEVQEKIKEFQLMPSYQVVASENHFPYYYSTWYNKEMPDAGSVQGNKVLILGSGPIRIGQGMEFDYSSVHAVYALKKMGYTTVIVNNNPETVSTDSSVADHLYFEPLTTEDILAVTRREKVEGVFIQFGGQTAINLAKDLADAGVRIYGTSPEKIDQLEDRKHFYQLLKEINIPHIQGEMAYSLNEIKACAEKIGYPVLVRPSYVIGGQSMFIIHQEAALVAYLDTIRYSDQRIWPILVDKYTPGLEAEVDVITDGEHCFVPGIVEHVEQAGVHSGDSIAVMPPVRLSSIQQEILLYYAQSICKAANIVGLVNIQFVITDEQIYVLEVNPRASRTIPMISKITGVPMVELAIRTQLGERLERNRVPESLGYYAVKAPVFSAAQLAGVDHKLGPEMKSTGEALGLAATYKDALAKATDMKAYTIEKDSEKRYVLCSITDREKPALLSISKELRKDFSLLATPGTSAYLSKHEIVNQTIESSSAELERVFQQQIIAGTVVTPTGLQNKKSGRQIRALAVTYQVPLFTSLSTLQAVIESNIQTNSVTSLQDYLHTYSTV